MFEHNECIHIRDIEEYKRVCIFLDENGYKWTHGSRYIEDEIFGINFKKDVFPIVIYPERGQWNNELNVGEIGMFFESALNRKSGQFSSVLEYFIKNGLLRKRSNNI